MKLALAWIAAEMGAQEWIMLAGLTCLGAGIATWSLPAAGIVVGGLCVWLAWPSTPKVVVSPAPRRRQE